MLRTGGSTGQGQCLFLADPSALGDGRLFAPDHLSGTVVDIPRGVAISLQTAEDQYQRLYELQRKNILVCEGPTYLTGLQQTPLMVKLHNYGPDIQHYAVGDEIAWLVVNWIPVMALQGFSDMEGRFNDYQQRTK